MTRLPVDPYWTNAGRWWLVNRNHNIDEYYAWLRVQGVVITDRSEFYSWVDFENETDATMFALRWS
jgi:hypothetical protein